MTVVVALESGLPGDLASIDRWLYAGQDPAWRIAAEEGALANVPRIDAAARLQQKAEELRLPFLEWVATQALANDCVEWWATQLAARTSYARLFDRVCALAIALDVVAETSTGTTLVVCSTPASAGEVARAAATSPPIDSPSVRHPEHLLRSSALRAWARYAPGRIRDLPARLSEQARFVLDSDPHRRRSLMEAHGLTRRPFGGPGTALLFTWIDRRSFRPDGSYVDPHLGPLAEMLRKRGLEVAYVAQILHSIPFVEAVRRLAASEETFLLPDAYLDLDDHRLSAQRASDFVPTLPEDDAVAGVPIAALAREHVAEHRPSQASALIYEPLLRRFAQAGVCPETLIYPYEGHVWELVLGWSAKRHLPETATVGYENLNMTRFALSMFSTRRELEVRPIPRRIVTNGPAFGDVLVAEGMPEDRIRVGCGLRHEAMWQTTPSRRQPNHQRPLRILAATEIAPGPSIELVTKAVDAFAAEHEVVVKPHPVLGRDELRRALGRRLDRVLIDDTPTLQLLPQVDVLLYTYTGVAFEALALGVPPVLVRSDSSIDLDQLEYAAELRWAARTPAELQAVVAEIRMLHLDAWRPRARAAAERALAPVRETCVEAFLRDEGQRT